MEKIKDEKPEEKNLQPEKAIEPLLPEENWVEGEGTAVTPFEGDYMDITIQVARHLEDYGKAVDTLMNFIIKRCYPGDFVSHDADNKPLHERTVNITGAAAERIARDVGVSETNRTTPVKEFLPEHPGHYRYKCEGDFGFRGRTIHAIGIASTRNPFYSKANGQNLDAKFIREEYIEREAYRDCVKQGIKGLFGLRRIPLTKLQQLGFDLGMVKYVNFKSKDADEATAKPAAAQTEKKFQTVVTTLINHAERVSTKTQKPYQQFVDAKGTEFYLWKPADSEDSKRLALALVRSETVELEISYDGRFRTIEKSKLVAPAAKE